MINTLTEIFHDLMKFLRRLVKVIIILLVLGAIIFYKAVEHKTWSVCEDEFGQGWATISQETNLGGAVCMDGWGRQRHTTPKLSGGQR